MTYSRPKYLWIPTYSFSSCGKHGDRYKKSGGVEVPVLRLQVKTCEINQRDFERFSMMSDYLQVPLTHVYHETKQNEVYVELVSANALERKLRL